MKLLLFPVYLLLMWMMPDQQKVICIQPLGHVDKGEISLVKSAVERFYHYKCIVKPALGLTNDILADSKTRYEANRILAKYTSPTITLILTEKDIAIKNPERDVNEWGVFGQGQMPGTTCVISTLRLKRNASNQLFQNRLIKVCLHEIGHNLGLEHCTSGDQRCLMNDSKGAVKTVDGEEFFLCAKCRKQLCDDGTCL